MNYVATKTVRFLGFATGLVTLITPAVSGAQEESGESSSDTVAKRRLMGNSGLFSAIGEIGGTYTYAPVQSIVPSSAIFPSPNRICCNVR